MPAASIRIREARVADCDDLTRIAHAAKRHWRYPERLIRLWKRDLTVTREFLAAHFVRCAVRDSQVVGFYAVSGSHASRELEHMWVDPKSMGAGVGRRMFTHLLAHLRRERVARLVIASDPNAEGFYRKLGAARTSSVPSKPAGRRLPLLVVRPLRERQTNGTRSAGARARSVEKARRSMRKPTPQLRKFLAAYDSAISRLFLAVRAAVLDAAPDANELVYDAYNAVSAVYTFSDRLKEAFCHVAAYPRYVNLGFNRGAELPDLERLLAGTGTSIRHIRISAAGDLEAPSVKALLRAAVRQGRALAPGGSQGQSIIKPVYPRKRRPSTRTGGAL